MNLKKYIYIKQNHFAYMYLKLTCYCKSTTVQLKKRERDFFKATKKEERNELSAMKRHGGTLNVCP